MSFIQLYREAKFVFNNMYIPNILDYFDSLNSEKESRVPISKLRSMNNMWHDLVRVVDFHIWLLCFRWHFKNINLYHWTVIKVRQESKVLCDVKHIKTWDFYFILLNMKNMRMSLGGKNLYQVAKINPEFLMKENIIKT